jgi:hypothetical protein
MFYALLRLTVIFIFGFASLAKLLSFPRFRTALEGYRLVPRKLVTPVGVMVLTFEGSIVGVLSYGSGALPWGFAAAGVMFGLFAAVVASGVLRDEQRECGCLGRFGALELDWYSVGLNLVVGGLCIASASGANLGGADGAGARFTTAAAATLLAGMYWLGIYVRSVLRRIDRTITVGSSP